ncbi:Protein-export membrane protein SecG [Methyloligella halotolerans]|uniref:Protein-export membrane protein SecG n=1 Tax=Methyloligella halotolerans TaxID=1177755 RepID=A0A1E2S1V4_9HYPH|nr:preprotein translocase subunit SecG [Methyloligella halotolerans]ODA68467.1 Protein-export membrane protein SecG [Methyloligella halotolerans]
MSTILLVIHLMIAAGLVAVVLLQRSEGGALGIGGGGGGGGGLMTGRGAGNALTRATAVLGAAFFATSLLLTILAGYNTGGTSPLTGGTIGGDTNLPALPSSPAPATPKAPAEPQAPQSE